MQADQDLSAWARRIEKQLDGVLAFEQGASRLHDAMRHAALGGGKRLRPLLVYATGSVLLAAPERMDAAAVAVELVHAFSLVHDDLPAMDDDCLRRGRATVHVAFDEATAILAGDALQALAFSTLAAAPLPAEVRIALVRELAAASGVAGMCAGQALDMESTGRILDLPSLERLHTLKTGALIRASVRMGALCAGVDASQREALDCYADALGLAFQIRDDILDIESDAAQLGKTAGKDQEQGKSTYPGLLGMERSKARLHELAAVMESALAPMAGDTQALRLLAGFAIARVN